MRVFGIQNLTQTHSTAKANNVEGSLEYRKYSSMCL